jgi:polyphenol oxidase
MNVRFGDRLTTLEELGPVRRGRQVHGAVVVTDSEEIVEADGQVVTDHEHGALVLTADCVPIALESPTAVAMLHGGWRGLAAGIVERGVSLLDGPVRAAIGPCARGCCYEVGEEVHAHFPGHRVGERNLALEAIAAERLRTAGVTTIEDTGICTICDERYFSYRREGDAAGRNASVIWR